METPAQNRGCHEYENISLSDYKMVTLLIRHRNVIYPNDTLEQSFSFKELMTCIYIDLDRLIAEARLTKSERCVITLLMDGWTTDDIAAEKNTLESTVRVLLDRAAQKVSRLHNKKWSSFVEERYKNVSLFEMCK